MKKQTKAIVAVASALAGMHIANTLLFKNTPKLESILDGEKDYYSSQLGRVFYVKNGEGEPLIFLHGMASGTSSFMWRKNFEELAKDFTVYAIDLPGFGKSDKMPMVYKSSMYIDVIKSFIMDVIGEPVNVIAGSQTGAYVIQLEYDNPGVFKKIISICPTGVFELSSPPNIKGKMVSGIFNAPIVGTFLYNMLVSKPSIKYFLKTRTYFNKEIASTYVVNHYYKSSRQNGAVSKYAPASFLGGYLNLSIVNSLPFIECPILIIWGENSDMNSINNLKSFIDLNPRISYHVISKSGYLPQEEHPFEFNTTCRDFLSKC